MTADGLAVGVIIASAALFLVCRWLRARRQSGGCDRGCSGRCDGTGGSGGDARRTR